MNTCQVDVANDAMMLPHLSKPSDDGYQRILTGSYACQVDVLNDAVLPQLWKPTDNSYDQRRRGCKLRYDNVTNHQRHGNPPSTND
jgi:hypothetical protein